MFSTEALYLTVSVDNADQAVSLSSYLNRHGLHSTPQDSGVECSVSDPATALLIDRLQQGWRYYWVNFDGRLLDLPLVEKGPEFCAVHH